MVKSADSDQIAKARRISEIAEREKKATKGPWTPMWVPSGMPTECCKYGTIGPDGLETTRIWNAGDVDFVGHARADIPFLLSALASERQAVIEECAKVVEEFTDGEKLFSSRSAIARVHTVLSCDEYHPFNPEPVAEPASPGEPPAHVHTTACYQCGHDDCPCHGGWLHEHPMCIPPARPSGPSAPQTSAEPKKQCGCVHGDSDPYCPDPLCPNYIAAYHVKAAAPQPVSGGAPGIKVTIYDPIAYLQELYADMGKRGECEICLKLQFCIEVLKEKLAGDAPKVEELADDIFDLVAERFDSGGKLKLSEIEEALRRYFPPASQTPKWKCFHCEFETSDYAKAEAHFGDGEGDSTICLYWSKLSTEDRLQEFQDLVQQLNGERDEGAVLLARAEKAEKELATLATPASTALSAQDFWLEYYKSDPNFPPSEAACDFAEAYAAKKFPAPASTARTDGWVSVVSGNLPKVGQTVIVLICDKFPALVEIKYPVGNPWPVGPLENGHFITHWQLFPAAPGSVPQAPDKFFCEQCKTDKPITEQYPNCTDSTICNSCAEEHISGKSL